MQRGCRLMLSIFKDSLLQLAIISSLIFAFQVFFVEKRVVERNFYIKILFTCLAAFSIVVCMSFPVYITPYFRMDFRLVLLLLGTYYGGLRSGLFLSAFI